MSLHVEVLGSGPPLVLLHGWAMHGGVFAPLADVLRDHYTLYLVDLPGHGHSRDSLIPLELEPCARAVLAAVPDAPWCGWSLGGAITLHAASIAPQRVPQIALIGATPRFVAAPDWPQGMAADVFESFKAGLAADWRGTVERFLALEAFGLSDARERVRQLRALALERGAPSPRVLAEGLRLLETTDLRPNLPTLAAPSLWIAGRRDRVVSPNAMQASATLNRSARFLQVGHAGHAPFLAHPQIVADALLGFLDVPGNHSEAACRHPGACRDPALDSLHGGEALDRTDIRRSEAARLCASDEQKP